MAATFAEAVEAVRGGADPDAEASALYDQLSEAERLDLLCGDQPFWLGIQELVTTGYNHVPYVMGAVDRLGIPGIRFVDGPRGVVCGQRTAFPVSMARGATWDVDLEHRIGVAIGRELRAEGGNFFGGVCINLPRHPAWGRVQETYSENPVLLGALGAALAEGVQLNAIACAKHYALNSMENGRFSVDVTASDEVLHEDFLAHFKTVVDAGALAIMSSYNSVNGEWAGQNHALLTGILRDQWGFAGVVMSDFIWGLRDAGRSVEAGLDIEAPFAQQRTERLPTALENGEASWEAVARSGRRIITAQLRLYAIREPEPAFDQAAHQQLAREAARRSMVLLKNESVATDGADSANPGEPVLPLPTDLKRLGVFGRFADAPNTGDHGSSDVRPPWVVTPLAGLREAWPNTELVTTDGDQDLASLAASCEAAVVVVGYDAHDEGEYVEGSLFTRDDLVKLYPKPTNATETEISSAVLGADGGISAVGQEAGGGDRRSVRLLPGDVEVIRTVAAHCPRTVICLVTAGAVVMREWIDEVPAVLVSWYAGMEGGRALADVLSGGHAPSGRLPYSIPRDEADLPFFDIDAREITYDRWYGQRLLDQRAVAAEFPLGFGLSYTTFELNDLTADVTGGQVHGSSQAVPGQLVARLSATNTGLVAATHVVQLYATRQDGDRAGERELIGFSTVDLEPAQRTTVEVSGALTPLMRWDGTGLTLPAGQVLVEAAAFSGDPNALSVQVRLAD